MKFFDWIKSLFKKKKEEVMLVEETKPIYLPHPRIPKLPKYRPRKAIHQDYGKFMKGSKHQHRWYRRTVKRSKHLEMEED